VNESRPSLAQDILAMCQPQAELGDVCRVGVDMVSVDWFERQFAKGVPAHGVYRR
jgi:hypothetical protein